MASLSLQDEAKKRAAARAADFVRPNMRLGLGTGSTADFFTEIIGQKVANGLKIIAVPTSERTRVLAMRWNIPLSTLEETPELDLTIDGADEFDAHLRLIKGGGGALLREKIVASASRRMIVITDASKEVAQLGHFPLPVEIEPFGARATHIHLEKTLAACGCAGRTRVRSAADGQPYLTDGRNYIYDCALERIPDPDSLAAHLKTITGVVEHGLFIGLASAIIIADAQDVRIIGEQESFK